MNFATISFLLTFCLSGFVGAEAQSVSPKGKACRECHGGTTPGIVEQWPSSAHAKNGVDCYSCHKANDNDPAAFDHYRHRDDGTGLNAMARLF